MRIIAGEYKGRKLVAPSGVTTRPTTDRVRESLMSSIKSALGGFEGLCVLDAFAGSGALGLEAMSRGAHQVLFCDSNKKVCEVIKRNVETLRIDKQAARVVCTDVLRSGIRSGFPPFDLVFLDPPYAYEPEHIVAFMVELLEQSRLSEAAYVVYEHDVSASEACDAAYAPTPFELMVRKRFGDTVVDMISLA